MAPYTYDLGITLVMPEAGPIWPPKTQCNAKPFFKFFFHFLLLFLLLVTFVNYFLLLKRASWIFLFYLLIVEGEGVCLYIFFLKKFYSWRGRGGCMLMFFSPPSFDMWKEEKKGVSFFLNLFFHCWVVREGEGVDYFLQIHNGRGVGVKSSHFQNSRHSWALIL